MCRWILPSERPPETEREIMVYLKEDACVYLGFVEEDDDELRWHILFWNDDYEIVEEEQVMCYLEYPDIGKEVLDAIATKEQQSN